MPNLKGPSFYKKKMLIHAILAILFYGITVWIAALRWKQCNQEITKTLRPLKRSLVCGYSSVSNFALDVISGIPPTDLLLEQKVRRTRKEDPQIIEEDIRLKWNDRWDKEVGNKWIRSVIPDLDE